MKCPECGNENREGARFCDSCGAPLTSEPAPEAPEPEPSAASGEVDFAPLNEEAPAEVGSGRFTTVGFLGEGARKQVYVAKDAERDGALVAVSVFSTEGMGATAQARARREAEAMAKLGDHPHTVAVIDSGQDGSRPYVASQYMAGGDLGDLLDAAPDRRLEIERALQVACDVAAGLEHAHGKDIIHRDIKPANIWLDADGTAVLGDFGLATEARAKEAVERMVVGTAAYLPPEQAIGKRPDERADLYSLGALLYEMLVGEPPFPGDDPVSIISRHLSAEPVPPAHQNPAVPGALDALVRRLLAKSPEDRPSSARDLLGELRGIDPDAEEDAAETANPYDGLAGGLFVGRDREMGSLKELLEGAIGGRGGVALIEGEPGIGKTRLAEELNTYARVRGAVVMSAGCNEADAAPPYWPFAQAIRAYIRDVDPVGLAWQLGADGPELARLIPELPERVPSIEAPAPLEGDESRFRFFEAVTNFLLGIARSKPLVFGLDDLHWADSSSLELLRFLASQVSGHPMLIGCAYRAEEAAARPAVAEAVGDLARVANRERIELRGLDTDAIGRFVEMTTGNEPATGLVQEIGEQTGGNPFFIGEVVRLMATEDGSASTDAEAAVPKGVREAVLRRISRLSDDARETLVVAAVAGREFDGELVEAVLGRGAEDDLEVASSARILERFREAGHFIFAHAVFREALYEELPTSRRRELHEAVGLALEDACGEDTDPHLQSLARHFVAAGPEHEAKAFDYSLAAARQAAARQAHAGAAEYLERAIDLLPEDSQETEVGLRLELSEEMTRSGRFNDARELLTETSKLAQEAGDVKSVARVALALSAVSETGVKDSDLVTLIDGVLAHLDPEDRALRARLLVALANELLWDGVEGRCQEAGREALEIARDLGDDRTLAAVLAVRQFIDVGRPGTLQIRLDNADEMVAAARRAGDRNNEIRAIAYQVTSHLQAANVEACDRALREYTELAERLGEPRHLWHVPIIKATRAIMDGRFADARRLSEEGRRMGELAEEPLAAQFNAVQLGILGSHEGDSAGMLPLIRRMVEAYPNIPAWRLALIGFLSDAERLDEARVEFEPLAARGFSDLTRDSNWLVGICRIGEAAARLGDADVCRGLVEDVEPFKGELVVVGRAGASNGPVDRYLGLMYAALGDLDGALAEFEETVAICERTGERPVRADARMNIGRVLLERDGQGDRERAFDELSLALEEGQELGMRRLVERCVRMRLEAQGVAGVDANASIDSVALAVADERPDLLSYASPDGRVTILFSDIENSTLMTERLGDERWIQVLRDHNSLFRARLNEFGGYEVKNQGDGFMLAFPDPVAALRCALAVQGDLDRQDGPEDARIRVRMGMHVGEVIEEEGDFFGRSVILAARIAAQARGGEVLVSEALRESGGERFTFVGPRELELKGLAGTHQAFLAADLEPGDDAGNSEPAVAGGAVLGGSLA